MTTTLLQLHFLTPYAPSNLNRDDLGRPKTALFGNTQRLRISSQSLKRAWRTSAVFERELAEHLGTRTKRFGELVLPSLLKGLDEKQAKTVASQMAAVFGAVKEDNLRTEQLAHITPEEKSHLIALAATGVREARADRGGAKRARRARQGRRRISLFGRMLAAKTAFNVEAACQVAHAISIHKVAIEDDYFTAVDDLKTSEDDAGAAHVGTQEFAAAVLYHYVCIDRGLLAENLGGFLKILDHLGVEIRGDHLWQQVCVLQQVPPVHRPAPSHRPAVNVQQSQSAPPWPQQAVPAATATQNP